MTASGSSGSPTEELLPGSGTRPIFLDPAEPTGPDSSGGDHFDDTDDDLDSEFAPQPRKRLGKLTIGLAALLVAGAGFLGGVQVQQHTASTSGGGNALAAAAARRGAAAGATGSAAAGAGGFGNFGGGTRGGTGGTAGGAGGTAGGTGATAGVPAVIGQIVSITGDTVVVKNLGGQMITVKLSPTTTITLTGTTADLKAGQNVTVAGATGADGSVTATTIGTRN